MDYQTLSIPQILDEAEAIAVDAQKLFGHLTPEQINWKPGAGQWSVGQCLEHLILTDREMFVPLDEIIAGRKKTTLWERMPGVAGFFGKMMVKWLAPDGTQKFKAMKSVDPAASTIDPRIVARFDEHQREAIGKMKALERLDPARIVMTSPFIKLMVYSALDACRIIVVHERRHFAQAQRVMAAPGFPK